MNEEGTWRPIGTAPKDGTWILIAVRDQPRVTVVRWRDVWGWRDGNEGGFMRGAVTHWQPLPPAPTL